MSRHEGILQRPHSSSSYAYRIVIYHHLALTEADIRSKFITPALVGVNGNKWDLMTQIRE